MEKEQIDSEPCVVDPESLLPPEKCEVVSEFEQKISEVLDQGLSRSVSEYSSFKSRNSRTKGSLIASSGAT